MSGKSKSDEVTRIAIVNKDRCKPKKCNQECKLLCPVNKTGKRCVVASSEGNKTAMISEKLCIGCDICVKKCPFDAIKIINLPSSLDSQVSYRYGINSFKLHRVPIPKPGQVLGLVGENGIGKSTALGILAGNIKPNFGDLKNLEPDWEEIVQHYRGTEIQAYFMKLKDGEIKAAHKVQYVDAITKTDKRVDTLATIFQKRKKKAPELYNRVVQMMELENLLERQLGNLSGGELQRFALAYVAMQNTAIYLIDEPSSYLDIKQRLTAGRLIRSLVEKDLDKYCVVVEHDLAVLDYLSDYTSLLYGKAGVFGIISMPSSVREGINIFLSGYLPSENMRFRDEALKFQVTDSAEEEAEQATAKGSEKSRIQTYPAMEIRFSILKSSASDIDSDSVEDDPNIANRVLDAAAVPADNDDIVPTSTLYDKQKARDFSFRLRIEAGHFEYSKITLLLGENGTGKSTLIKALVGAIQPVSVEGLLPTLPFSLKPQTIAPSFKGTVQELFLSRIAETYNHSGFQDDVVKPLDIKHLLDRKVTQLSGGELQRVALILALGKPADVYLIDEPSAYLDASQRLVCAKVIKRFVINTKKACFVVEHDFLMALYLADSVVVFTGTPGVDAVACKPCGVTQGFNKFLSIIQVTFRRDPENLRPRVNKLNSAKDREQKINGQYFTNFVDDS
ncbi:RNase L inhibitor [Giardia duodenalis assemblage B]|uniref:RNase L inhibitor n=2 Tax=Giardia intestinalis TaxID=5741 RepID=A0A132NVX7_GIAIN|nr:RNase L inhibitor [Giardia intestinalis]KWX14230.1 RNase L inhibitor [Giardia intestinalis assemblage B]